MTSRSKSTLERIARRVAVPEPAYERMLHRRDHNRRSQRIWAGAVGIAVFAAAVWIVTTAGGFDRARTPAAPQPTVPSPSTRVGFIGVPPQGATPSTPERGELVVSYWTSPFRMWVFADGRVDLRATWRLPQWCERSLNRLPRVPPHAREGGTHALRGHHVRTLRP